MNGLAGNDTLVGGLGNDTLTGGADRDYFDLRQVPGDTSTHTITDFAAGSAGDQIWLPVSYSYAFIDNPFVAGDARVTQAGADTLLEVDADGPYSPGGFHTLAMLRNVLVTSLVAANFGYSEGRFWEPLPIVGGWGPDLLDGTERSEKIYGLSGNDTLNGGGGDDELFGNEGDDVLNGGAGDDWLYGDQDDTLTGGSGSDEFLISLELPHSLMTITDFQAGVGGDRLNAFRSLTNYTSGSDPFASGHMRLLQAGSATVLEIDWDGPDDAYAGFETAVILQNVNNDSIVAANTHGFTLNLTPNPVLGTFNAESLAGGAGNDEIYGRDGNDTLTGVAGNDTIDGGLGDDRVDYTSSPAAVNVKLNDTSDGTASDGFGGTDTLTNIENVRGSLDFDDSLVGSSGDNQLEGLGGNDTLDGGLGNDTLLGGDGDDTLVFDASDGSIDGGSGTDTGVFSGASTAQARAFAMPAHSLEKVQWSVAGNTWSLALNGDGSRTETVSDTAGSEGTFASRTTRLAASGAVDWIDTIGDDGLRTYSDLDDLGNQAWTQLFQVYDGSGDVDFRDYRNDDGTRLVIDDDNLDNQGWTQIQQKYDVQGREDYRDYRLDDGRRRLVDDDQAGNQTWSEVTQLYDTQGREDYRDYRLDDGRRQWVDHDQAGNQTWSEVTQLYDTQGREDYRDYQLDDGRRQWVDHDQAGNQTWSQVITLYDPQGREDYVDYRLDDGRRQLVDHDQANNQAWTSSTQLYDTLGRQDYRDYAMDDGSRTFIDYDQAGQFAWSEWQKQFDAAGTLLHQRISYDSGDVVYQ